MEKYTYFSGASTAGVHRRGNGREATVSGKEKCNKVFHYFLTNEKKESIIFMDNYQEHKPVALAKLSPWLRRQNGVTDSRTAVDAMTLDKYNF